MSPEIKLRKRGQKGPTALERLERLNAEVRREIDGRTEIAVKYGAAIAGLNRDLADMDSKIEKKEFWLALEKGFEILRRLNLEIDRARDVFEEAEIVAIRIKEAKLLGADVETAEKFMTQAKEAGDASSALYFLDLARKDAEIKITQFEEVKERARTILTRIKELKERNDNTDSIEKTFEKARLATQYGSAIHYLTQCEEEIKVLKKDRKV